MLDLIIELVMDIFFLGGEELIRDKRIPAVIRYPILIIGSFITSLCVLGSILFGINCLNNGKVLAGWLLICFGVVVTLFIILTFFLAYKKSNNYTPRYSSGNQIRDFEVLSKNKVNQETPKVASTNKNKSSGAYGSVGIFLFIVSLTLIILVLILRR